MSIDICTHVTLQFDSPECRENFARYWKDYISFFEEDTIYFGEMETQVYAVYEAEKDEGTCTFRMRFSNGRNSIGPDVFCFVYPYTKMKNVGMNHICISTYSMEGEFVSRIVYDKKSDTTSAAFLDPYTFCELQEECKKDGELDDDAFDEVTEEYLTNNEHEINDFIHKVDLQTLSENSEWQDNLKILHGDF